MLRCTTLLLSTPEASAGFESELRTVDGIILITEQVANGQPLRKLRIAKMHGTREVGGDHALLIDDGGLTVVRRLETLSDQKTQGDPSGAGDPGTAPLASCPACRGSTRSSAADCPRDPPPWCSVRPARVR